MASIPNLIAKNDPHYRGFLGALILKMDIDKRGRATNFEVLASVPSSILDTSWMKDAQGLRFTKGNRWSEACSLERQNYVLTLNFVMGG